MSSGSIVGMIISFSGGSSSSPLELGGGQGCVAVDVRDVWEGGWERSVGAGGVTGDDDGDASNCDLCSVFVELQTPMFYCAS